MRVICFLIGFFSLFTRVQAQQVLCQQQYGQAIAQQGVNLLFNGGQVAISPDSVLFYRLTAPSGINNGSSLQAGLMLVRRGSCDTIRFASLAVKQVVAQGLLGTQSTFVTTTRRKQVRVLHTVASPDSNRIQLYAFTRRGQLRWVRTYASHVRSERARGLVEAPDGGAYLSTECAGANILPRTCLLKVDSLGRVQWQRTYASSRAGMAQQDYSFNTPTYTVRGNLLLTGSVASSTQLYGLVVEVNQRGDSIASHSLFRARNPTVTSYITGVKRLADGGFLVVSRLDSLASPNSVSFCGFTRLDANLNEQWTRIYRPALPLRFSPPEASQGMELADGSLLGVVNLYLPRTTGSGIVRMLRLSATGQLLQDYMVPVPGPAAIEIAPLAADSSFVVGGYSNSNDLATIMQLRIPGLRRVLAEPPLPPAQVFLAAQGSVAPIKLTAYPNPAGTVLHVPYTLPTGARTSELRAYDALGRLVLHQPLSGLQGEAEVNVQRWPTGLYHFTLVADGRVQGQQRIVITH
jgi:hypothetical protein